MTSSSMTRMFDVAILGQSLAYLEDPWQAFAEIRRVLKPNGRIAVSCRCRSLSTPAQDVFFERLERLAIRRARTPSHHALFGEPWVLTNMLEMAGFADIRVTQLLVGVRAADVHEWTEMMRMVGSVAARDDRAVEPRRSRHVRGGARPHHAPPGRR